MMTPEMKKPKEYFSLMIHLSLAMRSNLIFDLEHSLLEKKATAVELIRKRLSERPSDPRLWYVTWFIVFSCLLIIL